MSSSSGPVSKENKQTNPHRLSKSINNCQDICSSVEIWNRKCLLREEGIFKRTVLLSTHWSLDLWLLFLFFFFFNAFRLKAALFLRTSLFGVFRESLWSLLDLLIATKAESCYLTTRLCQHCLSLFWEVVGLFMNKLWNVVLEKLFAMLFWH